MLREVDLTVRPGEMTAIVGASGSGKTTLLQVLGTLDVPDSGRLLFRGEELTGKSEPALAGHRNNHIGFIFQFHHLLPEFSALENVMMPGLIHGRASGALKDKAAAILDRVGLGARQTHRSGELSGGEQRRLGLARALLHDAPLWLLDEPTEGLDAETEHHILALLHKHCDNKTLLLVTHRLHGLDNLDRICVMEEGEIIEQGDHQTLAAAQGRYARFLART